MAIIDLGSPIMHEMAQIFVDVQTELVFFALAIGTHLLFFSKWRPANNLKGKKMDLDMGAAPLRKPAAPNSTLQAFKAALRAHDVESAMQLFEALNTLWQKDDSPSSAPRMLMEQLVKLAAQKGVLPKLLELFTKVDLLPNALDLVLAESAGNEQEVRRVMASMRSAGVQPTIITCNKLLGAAVASNAEAVWTIIDEMNAFKVKPDPVSCAILLKSRCVNSKAANLEKVMALLADLRGGVDEVLFNSVVDACVRLGRSDLLMPFLKTSKCVAKGAHTYGSIIRAYGYVQDIRGAWDTWNQMRMQHIAPISVTLGCMVEALVTNGDIEGGYELIQEMRGSEKTALLVNAIMYGSIVKGFSHNKNFGRVWQVYDEMVEQKLQFSMVTYNTLIDTCARSGELSRIPSLLKDIESQGLKMGIVTYSAILKGYCQKNMIDEAFELFDDMSRTTDLVPDEIMFNSLIDGCARQGLYDRGMGMFEKMKASGVRPTNYTLSVLVKLADRAKKVNKAFEICEELSTKYNFRLNVHVYANLVQACTRQRDVPRAIGVLERMLEARVKPDMRTYSLLLRACIDGRQPKEAAGLLRAATGLSGPHEQLAKFPRNALQPQGGLPGDLISEILVGIANCREERLSAALLAELGRVPGLQLDPKLKLRLAARVAEL
jgi:pentatricopeptide repeat protein